MTDTITFNIVSTGRGLTPKDKILGTIQAASADDARAQFLGRRAGIAKYEDMYRFIEAQ